jgi:RNA recognition motif-containing protein
MEHKTSQVLIDEKTLFVGDLHPDLSHDEVRSFFTAYGKIIRTKLFSPSSRKGKGYAFVCFENREDAVSAMRDAQYTAIHGLPIRILFKDEEKKFPPQTNLVVENVPEEVTLKELHAFFA